MEYMRASHKPGSVLTVAGNIVKTTSCVTIGEWSPLRGIRLDRKLWYDLTPQHESRRSNARPKHSNTWTPQPKTFTRKTLGFLPET